MTDQAEMVARAFVTARREGRVLAEYPGVRPVDLAGAYRIQDRALAVDGRRVAGWKVGRINPPDDARLGADRLSGPIFADAVITLADGAPGAAAPDMPVYAGGFAAAEAELLLHVAPGWNGTVPTDDAGTRALLDDVRLGIEIASSPYPRINEDGPAVTISDFGNNAGLIVGAAVADWRAIDLCAIAVRLEIDGTVAGAATARTMLDGPYGAVRFLLANLAGRGIALSAGLWVSTGAITGVHPVTPGQRVRAVFDGHGAIDCRIVPVRQI
ncbi:2-keto-4-pentenoate hydratase [Sphingomonas flavalba]|uniref:2-keto-4-pentenoate hydratase n=1 Tax=Sphingomonas flavalba TaxID=2559804 RepID=UPI0039E06C4F